MRGWRLKGCGLDSLVWLYVYCVKMSKEFKMKNIGFKAAVLGVTVALAGCEQAKDDENRVTAHRQERAAEHSNRMAFGQNEKTGLCLAFYVNSNGRVERETLTYVPCTEDVLDAIAPVQPK
jgi:hypothetical protein